MRCFKRVRGEHVNYAAYYEFEGENAKRQIEIHPEMVLLLTGVSVSEASLSEFDFRPEEEIEPIQFKKLWAQLSKQPHGTRRSDSPFLKKYLWGLSGENRK